MEIISDSNFEEKVIRSSKPVLVEFWAQWCGPCILMNSILEEASLEFSEKNIIITKCNVDENSCVAEDNKVMNIPTFIMFVGGIEKERLTGALQKETLTDFINKYL